MRFGYWLPVFGGWLRNVDDERMAPTWDYVRTLARRSETWGYDLTLIAELNLNDIKGVRAPSLDVVSSWWAEEAKQYGVQFDRHDERYARTREWLTVVDGLWREPDFSHRGHYYTVEGAVLEPKPVSRPRPTIYAGGESETAKDLISNLADAYVMHGDAPKLIERRVQDMTRRREQTGKPPMTFGVAGYTIVRDSEAEAQREIERITDVKQSAAGYGNYQQWVANTQLEQRLSLEDYSVSNRGLRSGLVGTPEQVLAQVEHFADAGVDLLLLQCSPQLEEMERFAAQVIAPFRAARRSRSRAEPMRAGAAAGSR